jgi:hypothetical protein
VNAPVIDVRIRFIMKTRPTYDRLPSEDYLTCGVSAIVDVRLRLSVWSGDVRVTAEDVSGIMFLF